MFDIQWSILLQIILIDLILSGDNAILIAMAAKDLPEKHKNKAIIAGTAGAVVLRLVFALLVVWLLKIPFIQLVGGLLLLWIGYKLMVGKNSHDNVDGGTTIFSAIKTIIIADAVMSLDNVMALAGVSHGSFGMILIGILISIPIIIWGSKFLIVAMEKYPIIIYIGSAVLIWTAGEMIVQDDSISDLVHNANLELLIPALLTVTLLLVGYLKGKKTKEVV